MRKSVDFPRCLEIGLSAFSKHKWSNIMCSRDADADAEEEEVDGL